MPATTRLGVALALGGLLSTLGAAAGVSAGVGATASAQAAPTPVQVLSESEHALAHATNLTVNGYIGAGADRFDILVRSAKGGAAAAGTLSSTSASAIGFAGKVSFVRLGPTFYLKGDQRFWATSGGSSMTKPVLAALGGHWIRLPGSQVKQIAAEFGTLTNPARLATGLLGAALRSKLSFGPHVRVQGQPALAVRSPKGVLYVAAHGAPVPLELAASGAAGAIVFHYPKTLTISRPPGARTLAQIQKAAGTS